MNRRFIAAATFALFGILIGVATADLGAGDVGTPPGDRGTVEAARSDGRTDPVDRLETVRRILDIGPDQEVAWRSYADVTLSLARERREFDRRLSSGEARDDGAEYWRHQLILAAAINDLKSHLSLAQVARLGPLASGLAENLICNGLTRNEAKSAR